MTSRVTSSRVYVRLQTCFLCFACALGNKPRALNIDNRREFFLRKGLLIFPGSIHTAAFSSSISSPCLYSKSSDFCVWFVRAYVLEALPLKLMDPLMNRGKDVRDQLIACVVWRFCLRRLIS